jgi:hypothetical protein
MSNLDERALQRIRELAVIDVPRDVPLRLHVAAALAFPDGSMTVSGLRREARRGNLVIETVAGKHYVTLDAIDEMRKLCRVKAEDHAFGGAKSGGMAERLPRKVRGSSSTRGSITPQDALLAKIERRKSA